MSTEDVTAMTADPPEGGDQEPASFAIPAKDLVAELKDATSERAQEVLAAELARPEDKGRRSTVVAAAQARVDELRPVVEVEGEVLVDGPPDRAWAQLLDEHGEPVTVDGYQVDAGLVA